MIGFIKKIFRKIRGKPSCELCAGPNGSKRAVCFVCYRNKRWERP